MLISIVSRLSVRKRTLARWLATGTLCLSLEGASQAELPPQWSNLFSRRPQITPTCERPWGHYGTGWRPWNSGDFDAGGAVIPPQRGGFGEAAFPAGYEGYPTSARQGLPQAMPMPLTRGQLPPVDVAQFQPQPQAPQRPFERPPQDRLPQERVPRERPVQDRPQFESAPVMAARPPALDQATTAPLRRNQPPALPQRHEAVSRSLAAREDDVVRNRPRPQQQPIAHAPTGPALMPPQSASLASEPQTSSAQVSMLPPPQGERQSLPLPRTTSGPRLRATLPERPSQAVVTPAHSWNGMPQSFAGTQRVSEIRRETVSVESTSDIDEESWPPDEGDTHDAAMRQESTVVVAPLPRQTPVPRLAPLPRPTPFPRQTPLPRPTLAPHPEVPTHEEPSVAVELERRATPAPRAVSAPRATTAPRATPTPRATPAARSTSQARFVRPLPEIHRPAPLPRSTAEPTDVWPPDDEE